MTKDLTAWSYSRYKAWRECPFAFKKKFLENYFAPKNEYMERGIKVHEECAQFLEGKLHAPTPEIKTFSLDMFQELKECGPTVEQQWGFDKDWKPVQWFDKNTWVRVILDAAAIHNDCTADVVDHKTGKVSDDNDEQMELFAVATFKKYPYLEQVTTRLWYLDQGEELVAQYHKSEVPALVRQWDDKVAPMFKDQEFPARPNRGCRWCPFSKSAGGECHYG